MDMHRVVHLDLKGAPWSSDYLTKVIKAVKLWGATAVLIEWEDTFPYTAELTCVGSLGGSSREGLYNHDEVQYLLQLVKDNGLVPIQLVQTIGHMEFVLKHGQFRRLRELNRSPAVLCPTRPESKTLVKAMLRQVLDVQPDATFIHIGADEAWHINICNDCQQKSKSHEHNAAGLYLDHIIAVATFIKNKYPNVTVLMWDDMLRSVNEETLKVYKLGELVQPVVWNYNPVGAFQFDIHMWAKYSHVFAKIWVGSAYKGANGSCQIVSPVNRYVSNQEAWIEELKIYEGEINFAGVILTGWSRYDHYSTLCELLPVSLPSLASCIRMWTKSEETPKEAIICESLPSSEWAGEEFAQCITAFAMLRERCLMFLNGDQIMTWMNTWQVEHDYTSPLQIESIAINAKQLVSEVGSLKRALSLNLHAICGHRSAEEWLQTFVSPLLNRLNDTHAMAERRRIVDAGVTPKSWKRRSCE